ncbi:MAG: hypothetical protein FWF46_08675 [Oscillospiraceae bacterium]|nr:hypothetical protein [Oscillospiraceae bacterium]
MDLEKAVKNCKRDAIILIVLNLLVLPSALQVGGFNLLITIAVIALSIGAYMGAKQEKIWGPYCRNNSCNNYGYYYNNDVYGCECTFCFSWYV